MGKQLSPSVVKAHRQSVVRKFMAQGLEQHEIVELFQTEKYAEKTLNGEANPDFVGNPKSGKAVTKSTISRDWNQIKEEWRERAIEDIDEHFARQLAQIRDMYQEARLRMDLSEARQLTALEMKLLGTARPEKFEHDVNPELQGKIDKLAGLFQQMRQREVANGSTQRD